MAWNIEIEKEEGNSVLMEDALRQNPTNKRNFMKYKTQLRTATLVFPLIIAGCGSGGSSTESAAQDTKTITVIDGYLNNASICIDRNSNKICEIDEELASKTNELGQVKIALADAAYPIIVKAIAGVTTDSDQLTPLTKSYELIASANADYVTPFSTLAHLGDLSLQAYADSVGVDYAAISNDYVADTQNASKAAHLLARTITPLLEERAVDNGLTTLNQRLGEIQTHILKEVNDGVDLSTIDISYDTQSSMFYSKPKVTSVGTHITGQSFTYSVYSNHFDANGTGFENTISFSNDNISYLGNQVQYQLNGNKLIYGANSFTYLIMNDNYFLSFSENNDPGIWTKDAMSAKPTVQVENNFVAGKTLYHLRDINNYNYDKAEPKLTKLVFDDKDQVTVTPEGEVGFTATWQVKDSTMNNATLRTISIEFPDGEQDRDSLKSENAMTLEVIFVSNELSLAINHSSNALINENFIISDENLAKLMYRKWLN